MRTNQLMKGTEVNINMNEVLSSKWLANTDLPEQGIDLQMLNVTKESVGEMLEEKFALHFNAGYKPLLLNRTNIRIISSLFGPQTQSWIGKTVNVYNDPTVSYGGRITGGVRVRPAMQQQASAQQYRQASGAQVPPQYDERNPPPVNSIPDLRDDIPF